MTRLLVTGGSGQVGHALANLTWPAEIELFAPPRAAFDLADTGSVTAWLDQHPVDMIINAGAYTAVDRAEGEVAAAFAANAQGPAVLADWTRRAGVPLIHVSTDYVFDGAAAMPYREDDPVGPLGAYGASKLAGELAVRTGNPRHVILRTAWVLSAHGANFLKTMLRLGAERPALRVVSDQLGCPTGAVDIAEALQVIALRMLADAAAPVGTFHFVNAGETNWCELARAIFALSAERGGSSAAVEAIPSSAYPTPARRPANSRLATDRIATAYGIVARPWCASVTDIVDALVGAANEGESA